MKTFILTSFLLSTLSQFAIAGSANVGISCSSASGRTVFSGEVAGDSFEQTVSLSIDNQSNTYLNQEMIDFIKVNLPYIRDEAEKAKMNSLLENGKHSIITTNDQIKKHLYSITVTSDQFGSDPVLKLEAKSKTIKITKKRYGMEATFDAVLSDILDPRTQTFLDKKIAVKCKYDYSI